jgi:hypothetical protein
MIKKTIKQIKTSQAQAQKTADHLNQEVIVIAQNKQHIQVQAGKAYQLSAKDFNTKKASLIAKKVGNDLEISLENNVVVFDDYFEICATDLSCLVSLPTKNGGLYHVLADTFFTLEDGTQIVYFYGEQSIISTESSTGDKQIFFDIITPDMEHVAAVAVLAVVISGKRDGDDSDGNVSSLSPAPIKVIALQSKPLTCSVKVKVNLNASLASLSLLLVIITATDLFVTSSSPSSLLSLSSPSLLPLITTAKTATAATSSISGVIISKKLCLSPVLDSVETIDCSP